MSGAIRHAISKWGKKKNTHDPPHCVVRVHLQGNGGAKEVLPLVAIAAGTALQGKI